LKLILDTGTEKIEMNAKVRDLYVYDGKSYQPLSDMNIYLDKNSVELLKGRLLETGTTA